MMNIVTRPARRLSGFAPVSWVSSFPAPAPEPYIVTQPEARPPRWVVIVPGGRSLVSYSEAAAMRKLLSLRHLDRLV